MDVRFVSGTTGYNGFGMFREIVSDPGHVFAWLFANGFGRVGQAFELVCV